MVKSQKSFSQILLKHTCIPLATQSLESDIQEKIPLFAAPSKKRLYLHKTYLKTFCCVKQNFEICSSHILPHLAIFITAHVCNALLFKFHNDISMHLQYY